MSSVSRIELETNSFDDMRYCSHCAGLVQLEIPAGDDRNRHVCKDCGGVHYQNPKVVVGTIPVWKNQVLLCKRAIEPRMGFWTIPCGYLEMGETLEEGAVRETVEEANAEIEIQRLFCCVNLIHVGQVYLIFLADVKNLNFSPGDESLETGLFRNENIDPEEIAFSAVQYALDCFFEDQYTLALRTCSFGAEYRF